MPLPSLLSRVTDRLLANPASAPNSGRGAPPFPPPRPVDSPERTPSQPCPTLPEVARNDGPSSWGAANQQSKQDDATIVCAKTIFRSKSIRSMQEHRAGRMAQVESAYAILAGSCGSSAPASPRPPAKHLRPIAPSGRSPRFPVAANDSSPRSPKPPECSPRYLHSACVRPATLPIMKSVPEGWPDVSGGVNVRKTPPGTDQPAWQIMEVTRMANVECENGVDRVPPRTWLVIDPGGDEGGSYHLSADAGNAKFTGPVLLQAVAEDRLTAAAAQANLRHAAQGTSVVALRHAGLVLQLLKSAHRSEDERSRPNATSNFTLPRDREMRCPLEARASKMPRSEVRHSEEEKLAVLQDIAKRLEPVVSHSSSQHRLRQMGTEGPATAPDAETRERNSEIFSKGEMALNDFKKYIKDKFGNTVRAWFTFHTSGSMSMGEAEFYRWCAGMGFKPLQSGVTMKDLYRYLDRDTSGSISLFELDLPVSMVVSQFKRWADATFGVGIEKMFRAFDNNKSGQISRTRWRAACLQHGFVAKNKDLTPSETASQGSEDNKVFQLFDIDKSGILTLQNVLFLDSWNPPPYLFSGADHEGFLRFKENLCKLFGGSALRAWCYGLDADGSMRVNYKEFEDACHRLRKHGMASLDIPCVWRALDEDFSGYVSLREFDAAAFKALASFKRWAAAKHGNVARALRSLDNNGAGRVRLKDLQRACHPILSFELSLLIFEGLDKHGTGHMEVSHVRFLDDWAFGEDEEEVLTSHANPKTGLSRQDTMQEERQKRVEDSMLVEHRLRQIFLKCSPTGQSEISKKNLLQAVRKHADIANFFLLVDATDQEIAQFFEKLDVDMNGDVAFEELKTFYYHKMK